MKKRVVIIGAGFGGLNAAKALAKDSNLEVTLIDRENYHVFQPLLYQVATSALAAENIASPTRDILRKQKNATVIMKNIESIQLDEQTVISTEGDRFPYDYLIISTGTRHSYFGHPEWERFAPGLKTVADALLIREHILIAFEKAEFCKDPKKVEAYLRFVIVGGGPTGVELAGAIAEIANDSLKMNFRHIKPEQSEILLIEGLPRLLPSFPERLSEIARKDLIHFGVNVLTDTRVTGITADGVFANGTFIPAATVIWAAGNQATPLLKTLNVPLDKQGRVFVNQDLSLPGHPEVFVIGDASNLKDKNGNELPGIAPVAIQEGRYAAKLILQNTLPEKRKPFVYLDKGMMATIGHAKAVGVMGKMQMSGFFAWISWGLIHIFYLISFQKKLFVMLQWFFLYLIGERDERIITGMQESRHEQREQQ